MRAWIFTISSACVAVAMACASFEGENVPPTPDASPVDELDAGDVVDADTPPCDSAKQFAPARIYLHDYGDQFDAVMLGRQTYYIIRNTSDAGPAFRLVTTVAFGDGGHDDIQNVHLPEEGGYDKTSVRSPSFSADGKTLFYLARGGGPDSGTDQLYRTTRTSISALTFGGEKANELALVSAYFNGSSLWFSRRITGPNADRVSRVEPPTDNTKTDGGLDRADINDPQRNTNHFVAVPGDKRVYFATDRDGIGSKGRFDVWTAELDEATGKYVNAAPVPTLSTDRDEYPTWVSQNGCQILITRVGDDGKRDVYFSEKPN